LSANKFLLAIVCCHHRAHHTDAIRDCWVPLIKNKFEYKFFYGAGIHEPLKADEVILDGPDSYRGLAEKVQRICKWALENGYDGFFKVDDDTAWIADRLANAVEKDWAQHDYVGRVNGATDMYHESTYARGGVGYYLSKRAMEYLAAQPTPNPDNPKDYAEDSWVGRNMGEGGFVAVNDNRLRCAAGSGPNRTPRPNGFTGWKADCPVKSNDYITTCEFLGSEMIQGPHREWIISNDNHSSIMGRLRLR
jgi:hypothetical protein